MCFTVIYPSLLLINKLKKIIILLISKINKSSNFEKNYLLGVGEMAQWLRTPLPEDSGLIFNIHVVTNSNPKESSALLCSLQALCTQCPDTHLGKALTHKIKIYKS